MEVAYELSLQISIHALREEGDGSHGTQGACCADFYPRPPRGGRLMLSAICALLSMDFYPRPPRGGRRMNFDRLAFSFYFYPRPPRGGRQCFRGSVFIEQ